jgi:copper homeostasis protein
MEYTIEIATTDFTTTRSAVEGGASRIELCAALSEGGITPSYGLIKTCRDSFDVPLFPIIRPRGGDFLYDDDEFELMKRDTLLCKDTRCEGVVVGMLSKDGSIDIERTAKLVQLAHPLEVTFHRAFDRCKDPFEALEQLIQIGCRRVLTSGQRPTAVEGVDLIAALVKQAGHRIVIMPGSGVRKENIKMIADKTGATEFHSSVKGQRRSGMEFIHSSFDERLVNSIDPAEVKALRGALSQQ